MTIRTVRVAVAATLLPISLSGCFFVFIPGSLIQKVSDGITGAEGEHCVGRGAKVGDRITLPDGRTGVVQSLSGTSTRCGNESMPIRAALAVGGESAPAKPAPPATRVSFPLDAGWDARPPTDAMTRNNVVIHAINKTIDCGMTGTVERREAVSDVMAFAKTRRANQAAQLKDAAVTDIVMTEANGIQNVRFAVTGLLASNNQKYTYEDTLLVGKTEIAITRVWCYSHNFEAHNTALRKLSDSPTGM